MTGDDRADYYANRAVQARGCADRASSPQARAIHLDLAERYTQLLRYAASDRPLLTVIDGGR